MVDMGVGEQQEIDRFNIEGGRLEVERADRAIALEHTAIDQKMAAGMVNAIAGPGYRASRTVEVKGNSHGPAPRFSR